MMSWPGKCRSKSCHVVKFRSKFASSSEYDYVPAKVIDHNYKKVNISQTIINAGKRLVVQPGMGVVSAQGWVTP